MYVFKNRFLSILILLIIPVLFWSCSNRKASKNPTYSYDLIRFESIFFDAHPDSLAEVEQRFPYFFPKSYPFSVWVNRRTDSLQLALYQQTKSVSDLEIHDQLTPFMEGLTRIFKNTRLPKKVITITSDVDYNNKVILNDSMVLIAIDNFLGVNHHMYEGIAFYLRQGMELKQLSNELAESFANNRIALPEDRTLLAQLIYHGKIQFLKQSILFDYSEDRILGFTPEQLAWAMTNEKEIWNFFVSKELLYSTDPELVKRFISPAPFSKFYLNIDIDSPGQIGQWLGLQIVKAFQQKERKPITELLNTPYRELFEKSKYKPQR
ncbi:MAG: gliding motility lipoprotein GldB [Legionellales bacterium]|nr:gliding motility lipoprotein GldB [Legionellales bacterium]